MSALLRTSYDRISDVLYIWLGEPVPSEGDGVPNGIELDYALIDGKPCGATIIGFHQYEWPNHLEELGAIVGRHLGVASPEVERVLRSCAQ
jgi:hypothetical protein